MRRFSVIPVIALVFTPPAQAQEMGAPLTPTPSAVSLGAGLSSALANPANANGGVTLLNGSATPGDCLVWGASGVQDMGSPCVASPIGAARLNGTGAPVAASLADRATDYGVTFNLKTDFGVYGDGVHDDTAAIQAWLAKAAAGVHLVAPAGNYLFSAPLSTPGAGSYTVSGAGVPATTFTYTGPDTSVSATAGASWSIGATSITLSASPPASIATWAAEGAEITATDATTGKFVGVVGGVSGSTVTLSVAAEVGSSGASDGLKFSVDLMTVNKLLGGGAPQHGIQLSDFRVTSSTPLSGGYAFHPMLIWQIKLTNVAAGGADIGDAGDICGGYWFDGVSGGYLTQPNAMSSRGICDGVRFNSMPYASDSQVAELIISGGVIGADHQSGFLNGLHMAGGTGGLRCDGTNVESPNTALLIDNAGAPVMNRDFTQGPTCAFDSAQTGDVVINDPLSTGLNLYFDGWLGGASGGHGVTVVSAPNAYISINAGNLSWNCGSGLYVEDATAQIWVNYATQIYWNGGTGFAGGSSICNVWLAADPGHGYGVEASVPTSNIHLLATPFSNVAGSYNGNVAANVGVPGTFSAYSISTTGYLTGGGVKSTGGVMNVSSASGGAQMYINADTGYAASLQFQSGGGASPTTEWFVQNTSANHFNVTDGAASANLIDCATGGSCTIGESVGNTLTVNGGVSASGNITTSQALIAAATSGAAAAYLEGAPGSGASLNLQSGGVGKWAIEDISVSNNFGIYDSAAPGWTFQCVTGGSCTIGESSANTLTVNGAVSASGNVTAGGGSLAVNSTGNSDVYVNAAAGDGSGVILQVNGSAKWIVQNVVSTNHFNVYDSAASANLLDCATGGSCMIGESGSTVTVANNLTANGTVALNSWLALPPLPWSTISGVCTAAHKGYLTVQSDFSGTPTYNQAISGGGGTTAVPVFCDGTNWRAH